MIIETRDLKPELWPEVVDLFGKNGACAGCWCMWWRLERGEGLHPRTGAQRKRRFQTLVEDGDQRGVLAFVDGQAVGWCSYGPRRDFIRLDRSRLFQVDDAERVWSVPCFFVRAGWRGRGVSRAMLEHAVNAMKRQGVEIVEAYPVRLKNGARVPNAGAYTGTPSFFRSMGFVTLGARDGARQRMRLDLNRARARPAPRRRGAR